jgi:hypothetical protein
MARSLRGSTHRLLVSSKAGGSERKELLLGRINRAAMTCVEDTIMCSLKDVT